MGKRLYVGNLPFSATEAELREMFTETGTVESIRLITDRDSGTSKGFGFIEMATDEEAEKAISALHGKTLEGRAMMVNEARPPEKRENHFPKRNSFGKGYRKQRP